MLYQTKLCKDAGVCRDNRQLVLADNVPITRFEVSATAIAVSREEIGTPSYAKQPLEAV